MKLLMGILLVGVLAIAMGCQQSEPTPAPVQPTEASEAPTAVADPTQGPAAMSEPTPTAVLSVIAPTATRGPDSTPTYIWIPKYADPRMADKMINSYPATVVTLCRGIFGGAWSPNDPGYWETFDICAVNAQLGFPDPTDVATKGCVSSASGCKRYRLKE